MYWSLSKLMTPSRSRMTSFNSLSFPRKRESSRSCGQLRNVGDLVHRGAELLQQSQPRRAKLRILRVHEHLVEERVDVAAQRGERLQRARVVVLRIARVDIGLHLFE